MKQTTVYRATIGLLACVLVFAALVIVNQQRSLDSLREHYRFAEKNLRDYENLHQRDQDTITQLEHTNRLQSQWLDDTTRQMMEETHQTGYLMNGNGTVRFSR